MPVLGDLVAPVPQPQVEVGGGTGEHGIGRRSGFDRGDRRSGPDGDGPGPVGVGGCDRDDDRLVSSQRRATSGTKPSNSSSIPSTANSLEIAAAVVVGRCPRLADSASNRWIVLSWAQRLAQNNRGGGASRRKTNAGPSTAVRRVSTRAAAPRNTRRAASSRFAGAANSRRRVPRPTGSRCGPRRRSSPPIGTRRHDV